ncbi:hypothetical protein AOC10_03335 [Polynucleobacter asymbioticus]|jgi:hypothetical protein|nr:hypothetical protein AOC10_03335 [Polynucleobacter asymbioticus]
MQLQGNQTPLYKRFRTTTPERSWCINQVQTQESYWTLERCMEEASQFPLREQWERESPISYSRAIKRGWLTKCTTHIKGFQKKPAVPAKWTLDRCIETARQCKKRSEFKKRFHYAYERARLKGWLDICCSHMR